MLLVLRHRLRQLVVALGRAIVWLVQHDQAQTLPWQENGRYRQTWLCFRRAVKRVVVGVLAFFMGIPLLLLAILFWQRVAGMSQPYDRSGVVALGLPLISMSLPMFFLPVEAQMFLLKWWWRTTKKVAPFGMALADQLNSRLRLPGLRRSVFYRPWQVVTRVLKSLVVTVIVSTMASILFVTACEVVG